MKYFVLFLLTTVYCAMPLTVSAAPSWLQGIVGSDSNDNDSTSKTKNSKQHKANKKNKKNHKNKANKRKGPPAHAKAHGYRAKFTHYPEADIYENTDSGTFYEKKNGDWKILDNIPSKIDLGKGVSIDLDSAIPKAIQKLEE